MPKIATETCELCDEQSDRVYKDKKSGLNVCGLCKGEAPDVKHAHNRKKFKDDRDY